MALVIKCLFLIMKNTILNISEMSSLSVAMILILILFCEQYKKSIPRVRQDIICYGNICLDKYHKSKSVKESGSTGLSLEDIFKVTDNGGFD
ncbi:hypothetical protein B5C26_10605 [Photorhabdus luminescens]|nr:hypothetical protein B5C26_10605 [Photorhabdus luminescens]